MKEKTIGSLLALSLATTSEKAKKNNSETLENLNELQSKVDDIKRDINFKHIDITPFYQAHQKINLSNKKIFDGQSKLELAATSAQKTLKHISRRVNLLGKGVKDIAVQTNNRALTGRNKSEAILKTQREANEIARLFASIETFVHATDALRSKYKITPMKERYTPIAEKFEALLARTDINKDLRETLKTFRLIAPLFEGEEFGLFSSKENLLIKKKASKLEYIKTKRQLLNHIHNGISQTDAILDKLDLAMVKANQSMVMALAMSADPLSITSINSKLYISTRDMQIEIQHLLNAETKKKLTRELGIANLKLKRLNQYTVSLSEALASSNSPLVEFSKKIKAELADVRREIGNAYSGILAKLEGEQAREQGIVELKNISEQQRKQGQELSASINQKLEAVQLSVDKSVTQSTYLIITLSLVALAFSAAFSYITIKTIVNRLRKSLEVAESVSSGNLSPVQPSEHNDEISSVLMALSRMVEMLDSSVKQIRETSSSVNKRAEEISNGNEALRNRNEQQALHLTETASSTREITELVQHGAEAVQQVNELSHTAADAAKRGRSIVRDAMHSMNSIQSGANEISNIITVIDTIAFQTNILALNAAVEASRAGEVGRGFAVVAGEVRALASKSKEAANQIRTIIDSNVSEVEAGSVLVNDASNHMEDVVNQVDEVKKLLNNISASSSKQVTAISHIDGSVEELESMTQENGRLSEITSNAASSLLKQARSLDQVVSVFTL